MKTAVEKMWKMNRTIIGRGFDKALEYIKKEIDLKILKYKTGKEFWTWKIPKKWEIEEAYLMDLDTGERLIDIQDNILHVIVGSLPFEAEITKEKLLRHLHYDKKRPEFIPCIYKYYDQLDWGFCCTKEQYERILKANRFKVVIKSNYSDGELKIGEFTIQGKSPHTIFILTHLDGPAQANNNLSGVAVSMDIAKKLSAKQTYYTYKFLYLPGTIGPIAYLASNPEAINNAAGAVILEMLGNDGELVLQCSREGEDYIDGVMQYVLLEQGKAFKEKNFSDIVYNGERVFNAPGIDIPTLCLSRTFAADTGLPYYEYRTSGDTPDIITEERLEEARDAVLKALDILEKDYVPIRNYTGIPFLSKYGLWVEWKDYPEARIKINKILFEVDNNNSVFEIARKLSLKFDETYAFLNKLADNELVDKSPLF